MKCLSDNTNSLTSLHIGGDAPRSKSGSSSKEASPDDSPSTIAHRLKSQWLHVTAICFSVMPSLVGGAGGDPLHERCSEIQALLFLMWFPCWGLASSQQVGGRDSVEGWEDV